MQIEEIKPQDAIDAINNGALLVDVREEYEVEDMAYDAANVVNIPLGEIQVRLDEFPKDRPLIIGCRSGARSMNACNFLAMNGYTNVKNLKGGIIGWSESGAPTK